MQVGSENRMCFDNTLSKRECILYILWYIYSSELDVCVKLSDLEDTGLYSIQSQKSDKLYEYLHI